MLGATIGGTINVKISVTIGATIGAIIVITIDATTDATIGGLYPVSYLTCTFLADHIAIVKKTIIISHFLMCEEGLIFGSSGKIQFAFP